MNFPPDSNATSRLPQLEQAISGTNSAPSCPQSLQLTVAGACSITRSQPSGAMSEVNISQANGGDSGTTCGISDPQSRFARAPFFRTTRGRLDDGLNYSELVHADPSALFAYPKFSAFNRRALKVTDGPLSRSSPTDQLEGLPHRRVPPMGCEQLVMRADLDDTPRIQHGDTIRAPGCL